MATTHSTIITSAPDAPVTRHECACGFVLEISRGGVAPLIVERGDSTVGHTWDGQLPNLVLR